MMMKHEVTVQDIQSAIITLPHRPLAMLANEVAELYGVETKRINEAVKRNTERFPEDFAFQATDVEIDIIRSQNAAKIYAGDDIQPWLFSRNGINQLSTVLKSDVAIQRSIQIMRAFSAMEEEISNIPDSVMENLVKRVIATATPLILAQNPSGPFINTERVQHFLTWLPHEVGNGRFVTKSTLYDLYSQYCREEEAHQETRAHFFTKLYRCMPSLKSARIQSGGTRTQVVIGIKVLFGAEVTA